jgi:hypothetical protein
MAPLTEAMLEERIVDLEQKLRQLTDLVGEIAGSFSYGELTPGAGSLMWDPGYDWDAEDNKVNPGEEQFVLPPGAWVLTTERDHVLYY